MSDETECACVSRHMPKPETVRDLHLGGSSTVVLCPTSHDNVLAKMREFDREGKITPRGYMNEYLYGLATRAWSSSRGNV